MPFQSVTNWLLSPNWSAYNIRTRFPFRPRGLRFCHSDWSNSPLSTWNNTSTAMREFVEYLHQIMTARWWLLLLQWPRGMSWRHDRVVEPDVEPSPSAVSFADSISFSSLSSPSSVPSSTSASPTTSCRPSLPSSRITGTRVLQMWGKRLHRVLYLNIGLYWDFWDIGGRDQGDWDLGPDEGAIRLFRVAIVGNTLPKLSSF